MAFPWPLVCCEQHYINQAVISKKAALPRLRFSVEIALAHLKKRPSSTTKRHPSSAENVTHRAAKASRGMQRSSRGYRQ